MFACIRHPKRYWTFVRGTSYEHTYPTHRKITLKLIFDDAGKNVRMTASKLYRLCVGGSFKIHPPHADIGTNERKQSKRNPSESHLFEDYMSYVWRGLDVWISNRMWMEINVLREWFRGKSRMNYIMTNSIIGDPFTTLLRKKCHTHSNQQQQHWTFQLDLCQYGWISADSNTQSSHDTTTKHIHSCTQCAEINTSYSFDTQTRRTINNDVVEILTTMTTIVYKWLHRLCI